MHTPDCPLGASVDGVDNAPITTSNGGSRVLTGYG
jgi:hypothetical protein